MSVPAAPAAPAAPPAKSSAFGLKSRIDFTRLKGSGMFLFGTPVFALGRCWSILVIKDGDRAAVRVFTQEIHQTRGLVNVLGIMLPPGFEIRVDIDIANPRPDDPELPLAGVRRDIPPGASPPGPLSELLPARTVTITITPYQHIRFAYRIDNPCAIEPGTYTIDVPEHKDVLELIVRTDGVMLTAGVEFRGGRQPLSARVAFRTPLQEPAAVLVPRVAPAECTIASHKLGIAGAAEAVTIGAMIKLAL